MAWAGRWVGDYRLVRLLADGGMGRVWLAQDGRGTPYAVKFAQEPCASDPSLRERFRREAGAQLRLRHPHIARAHALVEVDGVPGLVLEYADGGTLDGEIRGNDVVGRPLPVPRCVRLSLEVLDALEFAHGRGWVHRDVKPSNILLDRATGRALLTDFGVALDTARTRRTRTGMVSGTLLYMSPEQIRSSPEVDARADVYGFGCTLYEMLTGRPPFLPGEEGGEDPDAALRRMHCQELPVPPRQLNPAVPASLETVVLWALAKHPEERPPGCGPLRRELLRLFPEHPNAGKDDAALWPQRLQPVPSGPTARPWPSAPPRPRPVRAWLAPATGALALATLCGAVFRPEVAPHPAAVTAARMPISAARPSSSAPARPAPRLQPLATPVAPLTRLPLPVGSLLVSTEPPGLDVYLDGRRWPGATPTEVRVPRTGWYVLRIAGTGVQPYVERVQVGEGVRYVRVLFRGESP